MLKTYLRELLEEYLEEIDIQNALSFVVMDLEEILEEIVIDVLEEKYLFYFILMG